MNQRIIYPTNEGGVAIITPVLECGLSIDEITKRCVPDDVSYKIIDVSDIPTDRTFRNAWEFTK